MATAPEWRDEADAAITAAPTLTGDPGVASAEVTLRLYNSFADAGADTLTNARIAGLARAVGSTSAVASGLELIDRYYVEARLVQGLGGKTVQAGQWTPIGPTTFLLLPSLASGEGVEIDFRLNPPADAQALNYYLVIALMQSLSAEAGVGHIEIAGAGIYRGVGDPLTSAVVAGASVVENPAGADDDVQVGPFVALLAGVPVSYAEQLVTIAASSAGTSRYVVLSLAADGTVTETDGAESASALTDADIPATPAGELAVARVTRDDTAAIQDDDITQLWAASFYAMTYSGTTLTVGPGEALVDNAKTLNQGSQSVALTDDATNSVWLRRTGAAAVTTDGAPPAGTRAMLLAEVVVAGGVVTAFRDRRRFIGGRLHVLRWEWLGTTAAGAYRYAVNPFDRTVYLDPHRPLSLIVGTQGAASGATTASIEADPDHDDTWSADLAGSADPPSVAFDATDLRDTDAVPESYAIGPGARLRAALSAVAGTPAEDAVLEALVVEA